MCLEKASGNDEPQEGHVTDKDTKVAWATYTVEAAVKTRII